MLNILSCEISSGRYEAGSKPRVSVNKDGKMVRRAGRPTGAVNRINRDIREMVLVALNTVGGEKYLARQAEKNPNAFMGLLGKILPTTLANADGSPVQLHLLAAQLVSAQLLEQIRRDGEPSLEREAATIDGTNLLDAPPPSE
jgi:hypothetical protein